MYDEAARDIFGSTPQLELLLEDNELPFAHEAGVFIQQENALYVTSNQHPHPISGKSHIHISRVHLPSETNHKCEYAKINANDIPMPNGGIKYKDGILFCAQGTLEEPGGIAHMPLTRQPKTTHEAQLLVSSFHGRPFNSPNDVVVHSDGSIWFPDPIYGWEHGCRARYIDSILPQGVSVRWLTGLGGQMGFVSVQTKRLSTSLIRTGYTEMVEQMTVESQACEY